ncbi:MAG: amidohydrolase [Synergistales bacterium]|nr:amidohydrolase [Synergistales bacterium]
MSAVLVHGGSIWVGKGGASQSAMLVDGEHIVAVGEEKEIRSRSHASGAEEVDLGGGTVLPGFTDAHLHLNALSRQREALSLKGVDSLSGVLERIKRRAADLEPGAWIYGVGFDDSTWPERRLPNRRDLDALGLPNPIFLERMCAHVRIADSEALRRGGLMEAGAREGLCRFDDGSPSGVLLEDAGAPVAGAMERELFAPEKARESLRATCADLAARGITAAHTCSAATYGLGEDPDLYRALEREGRLPLRIVYYEDSFPQETVRSGDGTAMFRYGGRKLFLDGSFGARTAALTEPYADDPSSSGMLNHDDAYVAEAVREAARRGLQVQIHAIGDAALDQLIGAVRSCREAGLCTDTLPVRAVHLQICRPDQIGALAELGVVADIQPCFVPSDLRIARERLDERRIPWAYAWKDFLTAGLTVTASSDSPVEAADPWRNLWAAVARTDDSGEPPGGWRPDQCLSLEEALHIHTATAPRAVGAGGRLGRLKAGCAADFVVLREDLRSLTARQIRDVAPVATVVGGRCSHGNLGPLPPVP